MMEYTFYPDLTSMLQALAAGVLLGVYYDAFRVLRRVIHFDRVSVAMQDILFWLTSAVYLFFVCIRLNNGYIRIYFVLFALAGWGVYYATVGRMIFVVFDFMLKIVGRLTKSIKKMTVSLIRKIYTKIKGKK